MAYEAGIVCKDEDYNLGRISRAHRHMYHVLVSEDVQLRLGLHIQCVQALREPAYGLTCKVLYAAAGAIGAQWRIVSGQTTKFDGTSAHILCEIRATV
jgi:hypothetical protein